MALFTDVSDISLDDVHCSKVLNSTLLDDQCAKNIQDVSILLSPIQGTFHNQNSSSRQLKNMMSDTYLSVTTNVSSFTVRNPKCFNFCFAVDVR